MSTVRRCDNPRCNTAADGGPATSETPNPAGWIHGTLASVAPLPDGLAPSLNGDFCRAECAAQAILIHSHSTLVVTADTVAAPPVPEPAPAKPKRKPRPSARR